MVLASVCSHFQVCLLFVWSKGVRQTDGKTYIRVKIRISLTACSPPVDFEKKVFGYGLEKFRISGLCHFSFGQGVEDKPTNKLTNTDIRANKKRHITPVSCVFFWFLINRNFLIARINVWLCICVGNCVSLVVQIKSNRDLTFVT